MLESKNNPVFTIEINRLKSHLYEQANENKEALQLSLETLKQAQQYNQIKETYLLYLTIALIYEKNEDLTQCHKYLQYALDTYKEHHLDSLYANYCNRVSSYYRYTNQKDSAIFYAETALKYATAYHQYEEKTTAHLLLGILSSRTNPEKAITNYIIVAHDFLKNSKYADAGIMYNNISWVYLLNNNLKQSLLYSDSALSIFNKNNIDVYSYLYLNRSAIYEKLQNTDSAYYYYKKMYSAYDKEIKESQTLEIKKISEQYESASKDEQIANQLIKNKLQKKILSIALISTALISIALVILFNLYRKVVSRQKTIKNQAEQLQVSLSQKEILLAEVQHRVKNNLQFIISLLEFQKEKIGYKSIEEITTESQNRIKSLSFLHNKLYLSTEIDEIDIESYLKGIAELLINSYKTQLNKVHVEIKVHLKNLSINEALSIGLILVELMNNSLKYAFTEKENGEINVLIEENKTNKFKYLFTYKDNGIGFNEALLKNSKGMGFEIIEGLVQQIKGEIEKSGEKGCTVKIKF